MTHILISLRVGHAAIQPTVLKASQVAVIHQNVQDRRHLTEDQNLETTTNHTNQIVSRF